MFATSSLRSASAALLTSLVAGGSATAGDADYYRSEAAARLNLPFSDAVGVGDLLFVSGQLGNRPGTPELVAGGIVAEARQAMDNLSAVLAASGSSLDKVVKCTVMLADIADWPAFNEVYVSYFRAPYPARSAFATAGLALGARVEVECIARR
jgi:reactive intermediate/imine deaminase